MLNQKALKDFNDIFQFLKRPNDQRWRNIRTTFSWQHGTATPVHTFIMGVPTRWELNKFEKIQNLFRTDCTL